VDAGRVDERIAELVQAHRPELEQLVHQAIDRELEALAQQELQRRGNGATSIDVTPVPTTRRCNDCGLEKPSGAFEKGRDVCRECRHAQARDRERRAAAEPVAEPPRARAPIEDAGDLGG
jgi:hypothetical protein